MKAELRAALISFSCIFAIAAPAAAFQAPANQAPAKQTCTVDKRSPSDADTALHDRKYADAERLYRAALAADPASFEAVAGIVRALLGQGKLPEALALATQNDTAHPNTPALLDALGEVRFRRGEIDEAATAFNRSIHLNPCLGRTFFDQARFLNLNGMYASAQKSIDFAHALSPHDAEITDRWQATHATPSTPAEQIAELKKRLADTTKTPALTDEEKEGINASIKALESGENGTCQMISPPIAETTKMTLEPMAHTVSTSPENISGVGLDVSLNGKRRRLQVDTGASGLLLSRAAARTLGVVPEFRIKAGGIGDEGLAKAFVTHVDDIRVGGMEFKNCMVQVIDRASMMEEDGLIGPDVFRDYVVTLDIPSRELRLGPLPPRPGDAASPAPVLHTSEEDQSTVSVADRARDRYIAPSMKDWTPVFRANHFLIFPTYIGKASIKLFLMDSGAGFGMISPEAAREVTSLAGDPFTRVEGINGEVRSVFTAQNVNIAFAGVHELIRDMQSFDSAAIRHTAGTQLSGIIGFPTLRELVISIDYRDNLVHVVYDPKHGFHAH